MESGSETVCEWTREGGPKKAVGADGNSNRYDESVCQYVTTIKVACSEFYLFLFGAGFIILKEK